MAGELKLNDVSVATESGGTVTVGNSNLTFDASTVTTNLAFAANHAGIKTALNASGSAPVYACRAWIRFNGTGTVSIDDSGNVSSITDQGTGLYLINLTTAMTDVNYSVSTAGPAGGGNGDKGPYVDPYNTGSFRVFTYNTGGALVDSNPVSAAIFR